MGFSTAGFLGGNASVVSYQVNDVKHVVFGNRERGSSIMSFNESSKFCSLPGRRRRRTITSVSCKSEFGSSPLEERTSPLEVRKEIERCYEFIHRLGRGVVYLGSARLGPDHPHYQKTLDLSREIAKLLDCTSWSGAGPGLMDAATKGALQAGKPVGGFKIGQEAGQWTSTAIHPYLPRETYFTCRFFSARKHGLVDAVVRNNALHRTAVVALPGGIGTLDEMFEILALIQLKRIGSKFPVPFLLMNYDSFYSKLLEFLNVCEDWGTVYKGEVDSLWKVCNDNSEALAYLEEFYALTPARKSEHTAGLGSASDTSNS